MLWYHVIDLVIKALIFLALCAVSAVISRLADLFGGTKEPAVSPSDIEIRAN